MSDYVTERNKIKKSRFGWETETGRLKGVATTNEHMRRGYKITSPKSSVILSYRA